MILHNYTDQNNLLAFGLSIKLTSFNVKSLPTLSLRTLKKHSTSSVELARGCSEGRLFAEQNLRLHSFDSILAMRATKVSLLNP